MSDSFWGNKRDKKTPSNMSLCRVLITSTEIIFIDKTLETINFLLPWVRFSALQLLSECSKCRFVIKQIFMTRRGGEGGRERERAGPR